MRDGVVCLLRVHGGGDGFVGEELQGREGDGHGQCGRVRDVESAESFVSVDVLGAVDHGAIHLSRLLHLHTLLDDWKGVDVSILLTATDLE